MVFSESCITSIESAIIRLALKSELTAQDIQHMKVLADIVAMNFNATILYSKTLLEAQKLTYVAVDKKVGLN